MQPKFVTPSFPRRRESNFLCSRQTQDFVARLVNGVPACAGTTATGGLHAE
jgi:hypothetical protein